MGTSQSNSLRHKQFV